MRIDQIKRKKICACIVAVAVVFCSLFPMQGVKAADYGIHNPRVDANGVSPWDCIYFGSYWQNDTNGDGVADQKDQKKPVKWRVLSVDGEDAFLLADQNLDCQPYHSEFAPVTWETCSLREWLNHYFYNTAFS